MGPTTFGESLFSEKEGTRDFFDPPVSSERMAEMEKLAVFLSEHVELLRLVLEQGLWPVLGRDIVWSVCGRERGREREGGRERERERGGRERERQRERGGEEREGERNERQLVN